MILIDQSAGSKELVLYPPLNDTSLACLTSLAVSDDTRSSADVCFTGNGPDGKILIGIEFCSLSDLVSKIYSGRLAGTQAQAMVDEYQVCVVLFYGRYRCGEDGNLEVPRLSISKQSDGYYWYTRGVPYQGPFETKSDARKAQRNDSREWVKYDMIGNKPLPFGYLESSLTSLSRIGIHVRHFERIEDCARWIGVQYRSWSKPYDSHRFFRVFDKSPGGREPALMPGLDMLIKVKLNIAKGLLPTGMGFERALAAAKYFPSARDMVNAGVEEWLEVPGIGKVIAKQIVEWVSRSSGGKVQVSASASNLDVFDS